MIKSARYLACAVFLLATAPLAADLVLDTEIVEVKPQPEDDAIEVKFSFRNTGDKAVTVIDLESTCGCLTASLDARSYAPGASGTGKAEFRVSTFVGRHEKTIKVRTDSPTQEEWVIPFMLDVPVVVEIEPRTLQWWLGEDATAKTAVMKVVGKDPLKVIEVTSTRDSVDFAVQEVIPGREYHLTVTPRSTDEVVLGALRIQTDSAIPKYQRQLTYFSIFRRPVTSPEDQGKSKSGP